MIYKDITILYIDSGKTIDSSVMIYCEKKIMTLLFKCLMTRMKTLLILNQQ